MASANARPSSERPRQGARRLDRQTVLDAAADLLSAEGPTALTVRTVAARAGVSVQAVYTLFGGKPGLCEALFDEGFAALQAALDAVVPARAPGEVPDEAVVRQVLTYRATALAAPGTYAIMFGRPVPEFQPSPGALARARDSFLSLVTVLQRALPQGGDPTPEQAALIVWALNHGLVSLELDGLIPGDGGQQLERAVRDLLRSWTTSP